ncbi:hypothetical protein C8Q73DRAFT_162644 [Cubamyces lactineus]|nr:hypothetical protein C8Q73DRAFT_162644 [Cubamyces lactineus]
MIGVRTSTRGRTGWGPISTLAAGGYLFSRPTSSLYSVYMCPSLPPDSDIPRPARPPSTSFFSFAATHTSSSTEGHASCPFSPPCCHYHPSPQPRPPLALEACPRAPIRILCIGPLAPRPLSEAPIVFYQYASSFSGTLPRPCGRRRAGTCLFWKRSLSATPQRVLSGSESTAQRVGQCLPPLDVCVPRRSPHRIMHKPVASRDAHIKTSDPHRPR